MEHKIKKLAFISSVASIGRDGKSKYSEKNKWNSGKENSFYALTKYKAENEVWRIEEGLSAVITNPGIIIGPSYWGDQVPPFLNKYIRAFLFSKRRKWIC